MEVITLLVLADPSDPELRLLERLPSSVRFVVGNEPEMFRELAPQADVILHWCHGKELLETVWRMAPKIRWMHSRSVGIDHLLFPELVASPVPVTCSRGVFSDSLGEYAIAAALFFAKDFRRLLRSQAAAVWDVFENEVIQGKTMGIVGYGDIGRAVAQKASALGMEVVALRRRPEFSRNDPALRRVFGPDGMVELLKVSDYVVVATPLTADTHKLVGEAEFRAMKKSAVLMNLGRGPVVDEGALIRALEQNQIRGAVLDVFEREPLPDGHPFYRMENVLLSAHCADRNPGWLDRALLHFVECFGRFQKGEAPQDPTDKRLGY